MSEAGQFAFILGLILVIFGVILFVYRDEYWNWEVGARRARGIPEEKLTRTPEAELRMTISALFPILAGIGFWLWAIFTKP